MNDKQQAITTLYVERIDANPSMDNRMERRKTSIDLEMSIMDARELKIQLEHRLAENPTGAIRIRFTGRVYI
jgi:hypothetical protein